MKKKTKKKIIFFIVEKFAWLLILFLGKTARIKIIGATFYQQARNLQKPILFLVWHGRMLIPIYMHRNMQVRAMVSQHADGEMIARTVEKLGYFTVRGSSTRGGREAFKDMLRELKNGHDCTILPDGPKGPRCEVKMGAILLAQRSGAIILPVSCAAKKFKKFNSWDQFVLPAPFTQVCMQYGELISIPTKITVEELENQRLFVQQRLNELQEKVDAIFRK